MEKRKQLKKRYEENKLYMNDISRECLEQKINKSITINNGGKSNKKVKFNNDNKFEVSIIDTLTTLNPTGECSKEEAFKNENNTNTKKLDINNDTHIKTTNSNNYKDKKDKQKTCNIDESKPDNTIQQFMI